MSRYFLLSVAFFWCACNTKKIEKTSERICTELLTEKGRMMIDSSQKMVAAAQHEFLWPHFVNFPLLLTVKFLNGTDFQKNKVRQYAKQWAENSATGTEGVLKIRIRFLPYDGTSSGNIADIRVVFRPGGSASYVGSDAKNIHPDSATMFFGWINPTELEQSIKQVVLHEFGHALGLIHEHQHPDVTIPWDTPAVYTYYRETQNPPWDEEKVYHQVFYKYSRTTLNYTEYDVRSIMHYAIDNRLTKGDYSTPWNTDLSVIDKQFIKKIYKYKPCVLNETCCYDRRGSRIMCP